MLGMVQQMLDIRPDICFSVVKLAQRQAAPRQKDVDALMYLIHFLYATRSSGVFLRRSDKCRADLLLTLRAFTDGSHACHGNGKSHYGFCFDLVESTTMGPRSFRQTSSPRSLHGQHGRTRSHRCSAPNCVLTWLHFLLVMSSTWLSESPSKTTLSMSFSDYLSPIFRRFFF